MISHYIKTTIRQLWKNKTFSFINIFGLAVSLSVCLLVILLIKDSHSYDKFHPESENTYRVLTTAIRQANGEETYATSPYPVGELIAQDQYQVEEWAPLVRNFDCDVQLENNLIEGSGLFADATFFQLFGFELANGDPLKALSTPFGIVLTKELADKIYDGVDPLGKTLVLPSYDQPFTVTGVLAPFPGKTHFEFEALSSLVTLNALERQAADNSITGDILNYYACYNFIRLPAGMDRSVAEENLNALAQIQYEGLELETRDAGYRFSLQALDEISPGPVYSYNMGSSLPVQVLWFFGVLSIVVMVSAGFNYTNLTIARAMGRAKEIGVRKAMGATRKQVFTQFICEATLLALVAFLFALLLLEVTIPAFNSIKTLAEFDISLQTDSSAILLFLGFTLLVGMLAGLLPASVFSKFNPTAVLRKLENQKLFRKLGFRSVLVVGQFAVSLLFLLIMTISWKQVNFAIGKNFAADRTDIVNIDMQGHSYEEMLNTFGTLPEVQKISASSHLMGTWEDGNVDMKTSEGSDPILIRDYAVDHGYLDNFGLTLVAGEDFPENPGQQQELFAIINEYTLEVFQLGSPEEAIGKTILVGDNNPLTIRGVVADFHYKPLVYQMEPLLLRYSPEFLNVMNLAVLTKDIPATIIKLEKQWEKLDSERSFTYQFYDQTSVETYADIKDMSSIVGYFGIMALIIAALGLLGITVYTVESKAKEISIRKIVGASIPDLVIYLSKSYLLLLLVATIIAVPLAYFLGQQFLQTFAFSIPLNAGVILPGVLGLVLLGILTILSQTLKAAMANPVKALKNE